MTTILLVSDSPTTRSLVRTCLTPRGYTLVETQDAAAAMAELQGALPGMVLQDLRVSPSEQLELASRLRVRLGYGVPILAFTRDGPSDNGRHTSAFNDTICKPIDPARLLRTVEA